MKLDAAPHGTALHGAAQYGHSEAEAEEVPLIKKCPKFKNRFENVWIQDVNVQWIQNRIVNRTVCSPKMRK